MWGISFPEWMLSAANFTVIYGTKLIIHSTIIITIGLMAAFFVKRISPSAQSLVLRSFLAVTLIWIFISPQINISCLKGFIIEIPKVQHLSGEKNNQNPLVFTEKNTVSSPLSSKLINQNQKAANTVSASQINIEAPIKYNKKPVIQPLRSEGECHSPLQLPPHNNIKAVLYLIIMFLWIICSLFFLLRLILNVCHLYYLKKISKPADKPILIKCTQAAVELNVKAPRVFQNHLIKSPFLAGIIKPAVFLPADETLFDNAAYEIFLHELSHLKRHDNLWNLAQHFTIAIIPFQPLAWILSKRIEETSDYSCDDYVIKHTVSSYDYAGGLFRLACYHNPLWREKVAGVGFLSFKSTLSRRITRIMDKKRIIRIETGKKFITCVLFVCIFSVLLAGMFGVREKAYAIMNQSLIPVLNFVNNNTPVYSIIKDSEVILTKNIVKNHSKKSVKSNIINNITASDNLDTNFNIYNSNKTGFNRANFDSISFNTASYEPGISAFAAPASVNLVYEKKAESQLIAAENDNSKSSADIQTGIYSNKPLFSGNTSLSASGFKENKIRMPAAKALNVQVNFNYQNYDFDLNNKDDRQLYNLYRNLDKNKNEPAWSPDGKWIAFTDHNRIWLVSSGGGEPKIIFEENYKGYSVGNFGSMCFTPDSKEITFKKDIYDENKGSIIELKEISKLNEYAVFSNPVPNIESVNIYTLEHHVVVEEGYSCAWSHNGRYLCYLNWALETGPDAAKFGLPVIYDKQTGKKYFLPVDAGKRYGSPSFSPDDKYIVLPVRYKSGSIELFKVPFDSGQPEQLTVYNENDTHGEFRNFPEYSPDGNWILYTDFTWCENKPDKRLFVYNMINRNIYEVFPTAYYPNSYGKWSPDGTKICYLSEEEDGNYIYICDFYPETFKKAVNSETTKPIIFKLNGNYPNPFNITTTIEFSIPESGNVTLEIYNISGQKVVELINDRITSGKHTTIWNGCDNKGNRVASGVYISRLQYSGRFLTNRMTLLK